MTTSSNIKEEIVAVGGLTGIRLSKVHFAEVLSLMSTAQRKLQNVLSVSDSVTMSTQQDPAAFGKLRNRIDELAEEYGLPRAFYGINKNGEFVLVYKYKNDFTPA